jgi:hypothetical protein
MMMAIGWYDHDYFWSTDHASAYDIKWTSRKYSGAIPDRPNYQKYGSLTFKVTGTAQAIYPVSLAERQLQERAPSLTRDENSPLYPRQHWSSPSRGLPRSGESYYNDTPINNQYAYNSYSPNAEDISNGGNIRNAVYIVKSNDVESNQVQSNNLVYTPGVGDAKVEPAAAVVAAPVIAVGIWDLLLAAGLISVATYCTLADCTGDDQAQMSPPKKPDEEKEKEEQGQPITPSDDIKNTKGSKGDSSDVGKGFDHPYDPDKVDNNLPEDPPEGDDEFKDLINGWEKGTFNSAWDSIRYHYGKHGFTQQRSLRQYLRSARQFAKEVPKRIINRSYQQDISKYTKNNRFIEFRKGKIVTYGSNEPIK